MPNNTEQPTDRAGRGTLVILLVAAAIGAGLWYALEQSRTAGPGIAGPGSGTASPTDESRPVDSGATSPGGGGQAPDSDTASSGSNGQTAHSGATSSGSGGQTPDSGTASSGSDGQTPDSDTASSGSDGQTPDSDTASSGSDGQTPDSGTASSGSNGQTAHSDASSSGSGGQTPGSDTASSGGDGQTARSGTASSGSGGGTPGSDTASSGDDGQTARAGTASSGSGGGAPDSGTDPAGSDGQTVGSGMASTGSGTQAAHSGNTSAGGDLQIAGTGAAGSQEPVGPVVSETTDDGPTRIAAAGSGAAPAGEAPRVAPAPESMIEKTPVDAPSDPGTAAGEDPGTAGRNDLLATVESALERLGSAIEERLDIAPEPDSKLELQITYDDSMRDAAPTGLAPDEPDRAAGSDTTLPADRAQAPGADDEAAVSAARSSEPAGSPESGGSPGTSGAPSPSMVAKVTGTRIETETDPATEAEEYVEHLTGTAPRTIPVDKADHFVTPQHVLSLVPEDSIENLSVDELAGDETLSPDTPITIVREVEQIEDVGAEQIIAESGGDLDRELRVRVTYEDSQDKAAPQVVEADTAERITVREALERIRAEPDRPLSVIRKVRYFEVVTLQELLGSTSVEDPFLKVVTRPYRIQSATLADLLRRQQAENPDSIFYIHTVQPTDDQGIWGIVHFGLIDKFARGVAIRRGEDVETYTVRIPRDADERLADQSSSFLGLMIDRKTKDSYVYNFREHRMGRNPDRILPGQELVIINFQVEELTAIYRHFTDS